MGIEDTEIVLGTVIAAGRDLLKALPVKPRVNLHQCDGHDVKPRLGVDYGQVVALVDDASEAVQAGDELVLQEQTFQILDGRASQS